METLASGNAAPANADNTAAVDAPEADAGGADTNGDGSAPSLTEAQAPAKVKDPIQERFDKLTRDKYDALREGDRKGYLLEQRDRELADLRAKLEARENKQVAPADAFPTLESVGYDEGKFIAAVAAYNKATTDAARAAAREEAQGIIRAERDAAKAEQASKSWATKEAEFLKSKPDYAEKVRDNDELKITKEMADVIRESDIGPQVAYYLGENPDKAAAIAQLPPLIQAREIGRIEAKLEAAKAPLKPAVSQAPPPVGKIDADDAPAVLKVDSADSDTLSDKEWTRRRNAQEQARLRKIRGG